MIALLAAAALQLLPPPAPANPPLVTIGPMDWDALPPIRQLSGPFDGRPARHELQRIIRNGICELPGATVRRFNIRVRYAALVSPARELLEVRVEPTGCRPLETLVASMVMDSAGRLLRPRSARAQWMGGSINFVN